jgi:hypothetical protein
MIDQDELARIRANRLASIQALLDLDAAKALVPHGIGGHARTLLEWALTEVPPLCATIVEQAARIKELEALVTKYEAPYEAIRKWFAMEGKD